jgi:hypothetical protein
MERMTTTALPLPAHRRRRRWLALRGAQALLLLPLGVLQLAAVVAFTATSEMSGGSYAIAVWAASMDVAGVVLALLLPRRTRRVRRGVRALLLAQLGFSLVKLTVYGETASLVFIALTALAWLLVEIDGRRHPSVL